DRAGELRRHADGGIRLERAIRGRPRGRTAHVFQRYAADPCRTGGRRLRRVDRVQLHDGIERRIEGAHEDQRFVAYLRRGQRVVDQLVEWRERLCNPRGRYGAQLYFTIGRGGRIGVAGSARGVRRVVPAAERSLVERIYLKDLRGEHAAQSDHI